MLSAFDDDDFTLIVEEIAGGRSLSRVFDWISPQFPASSSVSAFVLHCRGVCCCPDGTPLKGLTGG